MHVKLWRVLHRVLFCLFLMPFLALSAAEQKQPRLVVTIVVDQLRYDYLERFQHQFSSRGFRLFMDRGVYMKFGRYDYYPTVTGPGHASVYGGAGPAIHGVL